MDPEAKGISEDRVSRTVSLGGLVGVELHDPVTRQSPAAARWAAFHDPVDHPLWLEAVGSQLAKPLEAQLVFDSGGLWKAYQRDGSYVFELPHLRAVVDFESHRGAAHRTGGPTRWFDYPLDEILFSKLLADRGGLIVHACAVGYQGRGLLLAGESGAGKSTLAGLFDEVAGAEVLSDDRVAAFVDSDGVRISGTPWHGTARHAANHTVPLHRLFFLRQGDANRDASLSPAEAATRLLALAVMPYWDRHAAECALAAGVQVAERVPGSTLAFVPDHRVVRYVLGSLAHASASPGARSASVEEDGTAGQP